MNIWLINHYAVPIMYYPLARPTNFAKYLMAMGHTVTIFAASTVHNSSKNLITDGSKWREETVDGIHYIYIKCRDYEGNGLKRIYNICEFAWKLPSVCKCFPKPDAIVATSMPPTSCAVGIRLARKYKCKGIAEIADLWPESIVAYGIAGPRNPVVLALRHLEKWIYKKADKVVFTMEGAYDYIIEQGWDKEIPRSKVYYINNGVDLEQFYYNQKQYHWEDSDLDNRERFKVVYAGSIRKANHVGNIVDAARLIANDGITDIQFLIYGDGDERAALEKDCPPNVVFKGKIDKKCVPYLLSKSDVNLWNFVEVSLLRYGASPNKLFEYLASGRPIIATGHVAYNLVLQKSAGIEANSSAAQDISEAILTMYRMPREERIQMGNNAYEAAKEFDFRVLTEKLIDIIGD